ncbi:uncharacterized protein M437DRAFT_37194 [Aureobasidium melanogenum CBS 110374]|uniref:F-box domain-containing protein n=1 Tax=Aureobasidium melanogenum (strain CBS 110374) TaxID=1043003 RepID=A0A074W2V0_AURM1|nr:uncharacterized protein M437DRAFT_37194 [Aureobasidium melanogenum CBS 110374]KEQ67445.1 hypothetical protein M437DRAFT_37194 [Aureobasidium melanogenum CBS 110374]
MEKLPLELKQRVCSFLHANPKLLKPIRLVSKQFADAAAPYLLPRVFLVKHRDSCAEVREIADHPIFSKHVNTLVVDPSNLKNHKSFKKWWSNANKKFDAAVEKVTKTLTKSQAQYWKAQRQIATYQSTEVFQRCFLDTIFYAFEMCPNLVNIVISPTRSGPSHVILKLLTMFKSIHPHLAAWVDAESHDPFQFGLAEVLAAANHKNAGLHSLTIVDLPFKCADYTKVDSFKSFEHLKHVRIGYGRLPNNPKTMFGFNLEEAIGKATSLETLWIDAPPRRRNMFNGDAMLSALNSESLRDVLLDDIVVTEDVLVSFLLRHSQSLQQLDFGLALSAGNWSSAIRRISCQMTALKRVQIVSICELDGEEEVTQYSPKWCSEAREFIFHGGLLPEPLPYDDDEDYDNFKEYFEEPLRNYDVPEEGLWEDYDGNVNTCY